MKLLIALAAIVLALALGGFLRLTFKRLAAIRKIARACRSCATLTFTRSPVASLFKMSRTPDIGIELGDKIYLCRFYNGRGRRAQVHFANAEYSAVYYKFIVHRFYAINIRSRRSSPSPSSSATRIRVRILPPLLVPARYSSAAASGKELVTVLIFNPAPSGVSYVSDAGNSIRIAYTGDEFRGIKIYTGSSFAAFVDREGRALKARSEESAASFE